MKFVVYQCPVHKSFVSLCAEADGGGTRMLGSKCCPAQYSTRLAEWKLTPKQVREVIETLENDFNDH